MELDDLGLQRRVLTPLVEAGFTTVEQLLERNQRELLAIPRFGGGSLTKLLEALGERGLLLAVDPWAPYECVRHGGLAWDVTLESFFICDDCTADFVEQAFNGEPPAFEDGRLEGLCAHCNLWRELQIRQWTLCTWCDRVLRSIGRSVVSARYVADVWAAEIQPHVPDIELREIDAARLQRNDAETRAAKVASADFEGRHPDGRVVFGIELKTGRSRLGGQTIGTTMGSFQLDQGDCDDILEVAARDGIPVYLFHAQVIDRVEPPTIRYAPVAFWWTDLFSMQDHFIESKQRPRETKVAAYFETAMFSGVPELIDHLRSDGPALLAARIAEEGLPQLY